MKTKIYLVRRRTDLLIFQAFKHKKDAKKYIKEYSKKYLFIDLIKVY